MRRRLPAVALVLLASMATLGLPHAIDANHDRDFAIGVVAHDASQHQVRPFDEEEAQHPLHCLVCHWARSFRPAAAAAHLPVPPDEIRLAGDVARAVAPRQSTVSQPPLRSPPPVLLSA